MLHATHFVAAVLGTFPYNAETLTFSMTECSQALHCNQSVSFVYMLQVFVLTLNIGPVFCILERTFTCRWSYTKRANI